MPIEFVCPTCSRRMQSPDDSAGTEAVCKGCRTVLEIPTPVSPAAATGGSPLIARAVISPTLQKVIVVDLDMPFLSLVSLLLKVSLAAIPASIILWILWAFLAFMFLGITSATRGH